MSSASSPIRLVVADADGTVLTPEKQVTRDSRLAVQKLREAGIGFTLASGRLPAAMHGMVAALEVSLPYAGLNGALISHADHSPFDCRKMPEALATEVLDFFLSSGMGAWVYSETDWIISDADGPYVREEIDFVKIPPRIVPDLHDIVTSAVKVMGVSPDATLAAKCAGQLSARLGAAASVAPSQPHFVDVTAPDATKGQSVTRIATSLGFDISEVAVIGDGTNDLSMFEIAGLAIAMGNAPARVTAAAHRITASNEDEGFAQAIEMILGRA
ncbi:MAG: Cof-type HAD-IIB family hydrolase [Verrucomicrobiae bacterium]|nr:Cof-type HAD-IIB family hydrolase [Verrucomicrobiae bacterium]